MNRLNQSLIAPNGENLKEGGLWNQLQETSEMVESEENPEIMISDNISFYDPRLITLGSRIICPNGQLEYDENIVNIKEDYGDYEAIRLLYGVLEGDEVSDQFPLNMNFEHLNAISFNKGCYIGQELTQRTYHTGVLRKVAMPFICTDRLRYNFEDDSKNILKRFQYEHTYPISINQERL